MELHFSEKTEEIKAIEDRIKKMTLAYKNKLDKEAVEPFLKDGSKIYLGIEKMNLYLDLLDQEKEQWYYCSC